MSATNTGLALGQIQMYLYTIRALALYLRSPYDIAAYVRSLDKTYSAISVYICSV